MLFQHQFGFQKNKSTSLAILDLCAKLTESIENGEFSCCLFLEFAMTVNAVNKNMQLKRNGIRGILLDWFPSYRNEGNQRVFVGCELSVHRTIKHGVLQGSVLGPRLFLLYLNDHKSIKNHEFSSFC